MDIQLDCLFFACDHTPDRKSDESGSIALLVAMAPPFGHLFARQVIFIDVDTLEIRGARIRLGGIDAPESDRPCRNDDGEHYRCRQKAANGRSRRQTFSSAPVTRRYASR